MWITLWVYCDLFFQKILALENVIHLSQIVKKQLHFDLLVSKNNLAKLSENYNF